MIYIKYPPVWSQRTIDKISQKHRQLCPEEVEEAIFDDKPTCHRGSSESYCVYGQAISGRYIFIVLKKKDKDGVYKVITARDMGDKEKRYYRKHIK